MKTIKRWLIAIPAAFLIYGIAVGQTAPEKKKSANPSPPPAATGQTDSSANKKSNSPSGSNEAGQTEPAGKKKGPGSLSDAITNSSQPVQIEADTLEVFRKENKIIFTGKVVLKRPPTIILCRKLTAFYEEKGGGEVKTAICEGDVKITHNDTFARCAKAIFDNIGSIITMEGSPVVYQQNQVIRGDLLKYFLNDDRITGTNVRFQRNPTPPAIAPKSH